MLTGYQNPSELTPNVQYIISLIDKQAIITLLFVRTHIFKTTKLTKLYKLTWILFFCLRNVQLTHINSNTGLNPVCLSAYLHEPQPLVHRASGSDRWWQPLYMLVHQYLHRVFVSNPSRVKCTEQNQNKHSGRQYQHK